jgi:hypothetical protein
MRQREAGSRVETERSNLRVGTLERVRDYRLRQKLGWSERAFAAVREQLSGGKLIKLEVERARETWERLGLAQHQAPKPDDPKKTYIRLTEQGAHAIRDAKNSPQRLVTSTS